jgi:hypothetical protein
MILDPQGSDLDTNRIIEVMQTSGSFELTPLFPISELMEEGQIRKQEQKPEDDEQGTKTKRQIHKQHDSGSTTRIQAKYRHTDRGYLIGPSALRGPKRV